MGGLLGPVHTGLRPAKSAFSAKENTFGGGFQLRRPPAKQQCPRSQRQPLTVCLLPLCLHPPPSPSPLPPTPALSFSPSLTFMRRLSLPPVLGCLSLSVW